MSALKNEKYRYCLFYLLKDVPEGGNFSPEDLHITIVPWFVVEPDVEISLLNSFKNQFSNIKQFKVTVGSEVSLGPREDISVLLVNPEQQTHNLHQKALDWIDFLRARWAVKNPYVAEDYKPHIRQRENISLKPGDELCFNTVYLVRALRRADDFRLVLGKVVLDE